MSHTFHLIPHTHWDREWYLPRAAFQARLVPMMDDLLERLRSDPGYRRFLVDGQTIILEDYLRVRPEREAAIQALALAGRLEIGPWYVLADEQIPSGESLVRNLLLGRRDAERTGGESDALYSPDAFGHPAILPTLAQEFGLAAIALWRGLGVGKDLYHWRAPDGRLTPLYHLPPAGYELGAALPADAKRLPAAWAKVKAAVVPRAATRQVAVFVGADHHAAHPELPRLRELLAQLEPESEFRISRLDEFLRVLSAEADNVPVVTGELRWSYGYTWTLQGVHSTRAPLKRKHRRVELLLERGVEPLAALTRWRGGRDREALVDAAWRLLLQCQFHDSICGTVCDAAAREVDLRIDESETLSTEIGQASLRELAGHDPDRTRAAATRRESRLVLWNPASRPRAEVTIAELTFFRRDVLIGRPQGHKARHGTGYRALALRSPHGERIALQVLGVTRTTERRDAVRHYPDQDEVDQVRVALQSPLLRGFGFAELSPSPRRELTAGGTASTRGRTVRNELVEATIGPTGALTLRDLRSGQRFASVLQLESGGDVGDTYTYCPPSRDRLLRSRGPARVHREASGPLVATLQAEWTMQAGQGTGRSLGAVGVELEVTLYSGSPLVRLVLVLDNQARNHRLRARVPTGLQDIAAVAGAQFGSTERAPVVFDPRDYPMETPVLTAPAHRFAGAAKRQRGLVVLAPGFFECEWTAEGDLLLTLLRCVGELSKGELRTRPGHAAWPTPTPGAQCMGLDRIDLAIAMVGEAELRDEPGLERLWEDAFVPVRSHWLRETDLPPAPLLGTGKGNDGVVVELEGEGLVFSTLKPAISGKGVVLRCYNASERKTAGVWRFGEAVSGAFRVRADEREPIPLPLGEGGRSAPFTAGPREVVTVLVQRVQPR